MSIRSRVRVFVTRLLETGEWDKEEAKAIASLATPRNNDWVQNNFLCTKCKRPMTEGTINWQYMVKNDVWAKAGFSPRDLAHIGCLESRLGYQLEKEDFSDAPINALILWCLDRGYRIPSD